MRWRTAVGCWLAAVALLTAVALAATADTEAGLTSPSFADAGWWAGLAIVTAQALLLVGSLRSDRAVLLLVAAGAPVAALAGLQSATGVTSLAVIVAAFLAVLSEPPERAWPALAGAAALVGIGTAVAQADAGEPTGSAIGGGLVQGIGTVGVAVVAGVVVRARRDARSARDERARALVREQEALTEAAIARERTAMARELHDIAAHHLSGIAVMTGAIGRQIDTDPEGAKRAVREVRTHSTEMLRDLRKLVSLLREDPSESEASMVREESLAGVADLVEAARRAGGRVSLTVRERPDAQPPGTGIGPLAQLSAYRTVQEALANAARHAAGAACEVVVDAHDPAGVLVTVRNGPATEPALVTVPSGGFGLVGMRERAELTGARLDVGPDGDGGWLVSLRLPSLEPTLEPSLESSPALAAEPTPETTPGPTPGPTPEERR